MDTKTLKAEKRKVTGRKVKNLRKEGLVPANVYGKKVASTSVQVPLKDFQTIYKEVGETGLITLTIGKEEKPVLVHDIQLNPKTDEVLHVDFLQVDLKVKVEAEVPVEITGEAPAEKQGVGTVVQYINEIKVEALPADLPEKFTVDVSALENVDQSILVKDLKFDKAKVEVKSGLEEIVVKVEPPQKEEVVEVAPAAPVEGEVPAEGAPAPAEEAPKAEDNSGQSA